MLRRLAGAFALPALLSSAAWAQDPTSVPAPSAPAASLQGTLPLSLDQAIEMGLKNNLDVEIARFDPLSSWEDVRAALGVYDPQLFSEFGYESRETPVASSLQTSSVLAERAVDGQGGLRGKVPWLNATYQLAYVGSSLETNSSISELSPEYRASLVGSVVVPLLRNLIWDEDWTRVKQSRVVHGITQDEFRRQVMDTVFSIETSYWNLVAAEDARRVAEKSVETARALERQTRTQYEVGVVSRVEVVEAEAGIADREVNLIRVVNAERRAQDLLLDQVLGRGLRPGSELAVDATDRGSDYIIYDIDVEEAARKATENRPEIAAALQEIERRTIEAKYRDNQTLPQFDLVGSYALNGLAGKESDERFDFSSGTAFTINSVNQGLINPLNAAGIATAVPGVPFAVPPLPLPPSPGPILVDRRYEATDDDFFRGGARTWTAQGVFSIPIPNRTARALSSKADIQLRKSFSQLARLEQSIILEVRRAARDLESAQEGIEAAERARVAAEEQLRAERIRLEQGESTPFAVLQREEDLVQAESSKINAIRIYRNSITDLDRQQGTILESRNIVIDDVQALR
jgi:outer membrane protein TolC